MKCASDEAGIRLYKSRECTMSSMSLSSYAVSGCFLLLFPSQHQEEEERAKFA